MPNLKKLDDRTRTLLHLGTKPVSKAYMMFDPTMRKIVVSRDVVFDENKSWMWGCMPDEREQEPWMFKLTLGEYGDQGIREIEDETEDESNSNQTSSVDNDL